MASHHGSLEVVRDDTNGTNGTNGTNDADITNDAPDPVTVQMSGPNVVVRSSTRLDRAATDSVVHLLNASTSTEVVVVLDPERHRCSDSFASTPADITELRCCSQPNCRPRDVETAADGVVRVAGTQSWWTIDIGAGRFVRSDHPLDVHFIGDEAWVDLQGVWISSVKLAVLTMDGSLVSGSRSRTDQGCDHRLAG